MSLTDRADDLIPELAAYQRRFFLAGGIGALICLIALFINPVDFLQAYLMSYLFVLGITLGSLAFAMVHQLSGGAWGVVIRRPLGAATRTLPVLTLLFLPIIFGVKQLYPWADSTLAAQDAVIRWKQPYLNIPFFVVRAIVYFAAWNGVSFALNRWSIRQDVAGSPTIARRMQSISAAGLLIYAITISFAAFDWVMSLDPHWYSTIFGVLLMGGQGLSGLAFTIVALGWLSRRPPVSTFISPAHFHDLGNLLLAFVMLWAYFAFSQYLIIWSGDLPEEIEWYLRRAHGIWLALAVVLVLFHFAVPFVLLLSRAIKRAPEMLGRLALALLGLRLVDLFWLIAPSNRPHSVMAAWVYLILPAALGTFWLGCFVQQLRTRPLLPLGDPELLDALELRTGAAHTDVRLS